MHRYAAKRAMDGVCFYAPGERSGVCCDSGGDDCGRREADMTSLLGQAIRSAADMQGRAKWAWLEDRRESSQLCAGQELVRVGHEVMRVRRPSKAVPLWSADSIHPDSPASLWRRRERGNRPGYGYFRLKMPKLDQPLPVANLTSPSPTMYTCTTTVGLCFLHTCTELSRESGQLGYKHSTSINIGNSRSG